MVELLPQYLQLKEEIDAAVAEVITSTRYIGGPKVKAFQEALQQYLDIEQVIPCANGTDALQIALMALELQAGDEIIVPSFTYVATAEVIGLLGLTPVMVDVDVETFNTTAELVEPFITPRTKAIIPVHLFGQSTDMEGIIQLAEKYNLYVIEDNAQAIGADYTFSDGTKKKTGTIGHIGTTSFFPSKNLGCYGDGGAIFTKDAKLAAKIKMIANHGQSKQYHHARLGVNSRLDALQAAVLHIKLRRLDQYNTNRQEVAQKYDTAFATIPQLQIPKRQANSTHVFHQYTLKVADRQRDALKSFLQKQGIPSMIYYPIPLYRQEAFVHYFQNCEPLQNTEQISTEVLSLPIHSEMKTAVQDYIIQGVLDFYTS